LGATLVVAGSLNEAAYGRGGTYEECFSGAPRPDVALALSGCHYEYQGQRLDFDPNTPSSTNRDTDLVLVAGEDDTICAAWQSEDATAALQSSGHGAKFVKIADANHFSVIFHNVVDDEWITLPDDPAGTEVAQTILAAIDAARG
jgi:alpha-beta hydrolase superfamily lysophospholipase